MTLSTAINSAVIAAAASLAVPALAEVAIEFGEGQDEVPKLDAASGVAYTTCYFDDGKNVAWDWGVTKSGTYYYLNGAWKKTRLIGETKYFSEDSVEDMKASCQNIKDQKKIKGELLAVFASGGTYNYYIIQDGEELYPTF